MRKLKKILIGMVILIVGIIILVMMVTQGVVDVAEGQLKAIREGNIIKAYSFTSKDFRSATTFEDFKNFIDNYPLLKINKSVSFTSRETNNGQVILVGSFKSVVGGTTPIEYKLVKENGDWKIFNMKLNRSGAGIQQTRPATSSRLLKKNTFPGIIQNPTKIFDVSINNIADQNDYVDANKSILNKNLSKIFATASIDNVTERLNVTMELKYIPSGQTIDSSTQEIVPLGDVRIPFSFTKTHGSWLTGGYKITTTLSNGDKKETNFSVN